MSENSVIRPISEISGNADAYFDPVLIKEGALNRLYRVSRDGKYYIVKTIKDDSGMLESLLRREYELSRGLSHQNIVNVFTYDTDTLVGTGIVMEYIDGRTLDEFLAENPSRQLRSRVLGQLLDAVAYLHRKGIVHNDLKPENILISRVDNTLKLIDFGLSDSAAYYLTRNLGCSPKYASPELLERLHTDCRSDIYSLGLLMREITEGRYRRIWSRACAFHRHKRYANVEQMQRALGAGRVLLMLVFAVSLIGLLVLCVHDAFLVKRLQERNTELQSQVEILTNEQLAQVERRQFLDSVYLDIDSRLKNIYEPLLEKLVAMPSQQECEGVMNSSVLQLSEVMTSYQSSTNDQELQSILKSYYVNRQTAYFQKCLEIISEKPLW